MYAEQGALQAVFDRIRSIDMLYQMIIYTFLTMVTLLAAVLALLAMTYRQTRPHRPTRLPKRRDVHRRQGLGALDQMRDVKTQTTSGAPAAFSVAPTGPLAPSAKVLEPQFSAAQADPQDWRDGPSKLPVIPPAISVSDILDTITQETMRYRSVPAATVRRISIADLPVLNYQEH